MASLPRGALSRAAAVGALAASSLVAVTAIEAAANGVTPNEACTAAGGVPGQIGSDPTCMFTTANTATKPSYTIAVPTGVTALSITVRGAQGGSAHTGGGGGLGAEVGGTFSVTVGANVALVVGGRGGTPAGGFPDGGLGASGPAGGGGGSSRVSVGGTVLAIAGGGGGDALSQLTLGGRGGNAGADGADGPSEGNTAGTLISQGGRGGKTNGTGGARGVNLRVAPASCLTGSGPGAPGTDGTAQRGGTGGLPYRPAGGSLNGGGGGGGGGGLIGGGGGGGGAWCRSNPNTYNGGDGGGGGGQSYVDASAAAGWAFEGNDAPQLGAGLVLLHWHVELPAVAVNDAATVKQGKQVKIPVLANDFDPDAPGGGGLSASDYVPSVVGELPNADVTLNSDGTFTYAPAASFVGADSFGYQVCEVLNPSACSNVATVSVKVTARNLVANGGFEKPKLNTGQTFRTILAGSKVGAWSVTAGSVDVIANQNWAAAAGSQSLDLAGNGPGTIRQTLSLPNSATYRIGWKLAGNMYCGDRKVRMGVLWNGSTVKTVTFNTAGRTPTSPGWVTKSVKVPGGLGSATLAFTSLKKGSCGPALDAVAVKQLPG